MENNSEGSFYRNEMFDGFVSLEHTIWLNTWDGN